MKQLTMFLSGILLSSCVIMINSEYETQMRYFSERGYVTGYRDASEGVYSMWVDSSGCYHWWISPWESGEEPVYKPCGE